MARDVARFAARALALDGWVRPVAMSRARSQEVRMVDRWARGSHGPADARATYVGESMSDLLTYRVFLGGPIHGKRRKTEAELADGAEGDEDRLVSRERRAVRRATPLGRWAAVWGEGEERRALM